MTLEVVISGGQTGVDRGALDAAIALGIYHAGFCPKGRKAEDGVIPACYELQEHASADYRKRTEANIFASDATLVLTIGEPTGGTLLTMNLASRCNKPLVVVDLVLLARFHREPDLVAKWIVEHKVRMLNVAGPRESKHVGIQRATADYLMAAFRPFRPKRGER